MATGTWALGWASGDIVSAAEYAKSVGCIYDTTLGSGAASIDVTSIIGSYAHLLLVAYLRSTTAAQSTDLVLRFNGDSGANYGYAGVGRQTANFNTVTATSLGGGADAPIPGASATAGGFGALLMLIPHYANSANHKSAVYMAGQGSGSTTTDLTNAFAAGAWRSTSAINRVTISAAAGNLDTGSRFSIYAMGA